MFNYDIIPPTVSCQAKSMNVQ